MYPVPTQTWNEQDHWRCWPPGLRLEEVYFCHCVYTKSQTGCVKMQDMKMRDRKMKDMKNAGQVQHNTTHRQFMRKLKCNDRQEHRNSNNILITNLPMIQWEKQWNVNINRHSYKKNVANTNVVLIKLTEIPTITATCELPVCCIFMSYMFLSCIFMPCNLVLHFHVLHFQRPQSNKQVAAVTCRPPG